LVPFLHFSPIPKKTAFCQLSFKSLASHYEIFSTRTSRVSFILPFLHWVWMTDTRPLFIQMPDTFLRIFLFPLAWNAQVGPLSFISLPSMLLAGPERASFAPFLVDGFKTLILLAFCPLCSLPSFDTCGWVLQVFSGPFSPSVSFLSALSLFFPALSLSFRRQLDGESPLFHRSPSFLGGVGFDMVVVEDGSWAHASYLLSLSNWSSSLTILLNPLDSANFRERTPWMILLPSSFSPPSCSRPRPKELFFDRFCFVISLRTAYLIYCSHGLIKRLSLLPSFPLPFSGCPPPKVFFSSRKITSFPPPSFSSSSLFFFSESDPSL